MILMAFGVILILDGLISLVIFRRQEWYCQAVRVVRTIIGIALLYWRI